MFTANGRVETIRIGDNGQSSAFEFLPEFWKRGGGRHIQRCFVATCFGGWVREWGEGERAGGDVWDDSPGISPFTHSHAASNHGEKRGREKPVSCCPPFQPHVLTRNTSLKGGGRGMNRKLKLNISGTITQRFWEGGIPSCYYTVDVTTLMVTYVPGHPLPSTSTVGFRAVAAYCRPPGVEMSVVDVELCVLAG